MLLYIIIFTMTVTNNYWISVITIVFLTTVNSQRPVHATKIQEGCWSEPQQGWNQAVNLVRSNLNRAHNYVTDQAAQGLQEQAEGLLNAKQPLLLKQMLAAPPLISENPTQHLRHKPLLTIISSAAQQLNDHVTHLFVFSSLITRKNKQKKHNKDRHENKINQCRRITAVKPEQKSRSCIQKWH